MYMLNMVIILIVMYCNVVTAIDKIPTYLLRFNSFVKALQGPEVLNMRRVLWGSRWSVVQGLDEGVAAQARQRLRGKQVDCKLETKTRLKTATAGYL